MSEDHLERIVAYMKLHAKHELSLDDIAAHFQVNKFVLTRQFQKRYGLSPIAYFHLVRIEMIKDYLVESEDSLQAIAKQLNFRSLSYFSQFFRRYTTQSPSQYRRQERLRRRRFEREKEISALQMNQVKEFSPRPSLFTMSCDEIRSHLNRNQNQSEQDVLSHSFFGSPFTQAAKNQLNSKNSSIFQSDYFDAPQHLQQDELAIEEDTFNSENNKESNE